MSFRTHSNPSTIDLMPDKHLEPLNDVIELVIRGNITNPTIEKSNIGVTRIVLNLNTASHQIVQTLTGHLNANQISKIVALWSDDKTPRKFYLTTSGELGIRLE